VGGAAALPGIVVEAAVKVLITGGAGYIGSMVALACADAGITPVTVDLVAGGPPYSPHSYRGDIADGPLISRIFAKHPDIAAAVHCAALTSVPESVADPARYWRANVTGTLELAGHLLRCGCTRLVYSSSAAVYAPAPGLVVHEDSPLGPASPYARTKAACEALLADIAAATELRVLSLRYFNPIGADPQLRTGPRRQSHVLGAMITAQRDGVPFVITGTDWPTRDGTGLRDYVHITDLAAAHTAALRYLDSLPTPSELVRPMTTVNIGTGRGTTVRELLAAFETVTGRPLQVTEGPRRPGDTAGARALAERAERLLGWRASYSTIQAIAHALQWTTE
jgi:UDP-glucose 4-epimerase